MNFSGLSQEWSRLPGEGIWRLDDALRLIRLISPICHLYGYNLHLGGGVLNRGFSTKDLDILAMPRFQVGQDVPSMLEGIVKVAPAYTLKNGVNELPYRNVFCFEHRGCLPVELIVVVL